MYAHKHSGAGGGTHPGANPLRRLWLAYQPRWPVSIRSALTAVRRSEMQLAHRSMQATQRFKPHCTAHHTHTVATTVRPCASANSFTAPFTAPKFTVPSMHTADGACIGLLICGAQSASGEGCRTRRDPRWTAQPLGASPL